MSFTVVAAPHRPEPGTDVAALGCEAAGVAVDVRDLAVVAGRRRLLSGVSLSARGGEVLAVAGASGSGKSTLIEAMAGLRPISGGSVRFVRSRARTSAGSVAVGFVPQDDVIHRDLPLRDSLRYAAGLRLPRPLPAPDLDVLIDGILARLGLTQVAEVRVGDLSGGQRKRASIATELLTRPDVLFLDEPTSGLDPATAAGVMRILHGLAATGTTVVFTTHALADLDQADRIAIVGGEGRLCFVGSPDEARSVVGSDDLAELYALPQTAPVDRPSAPSVPSPGPGGNEAALRPPRAAGGLRQWAVLTRRNLALLFANRLTLVILFGSPTLVVAMMVVLFPAGTAADPLGHPTTAIQTTFWIAFAGFFFGLTAGLLQIVPEAAIARREGRAGVNPVAYVFSKLAALAPALVLVSVGMLVVLHQMDRLPTTAGSSLSGVGVTVLLESLSALALGLLASAAVRDASQATLALPMLCFPQVLFAGAVIAVADMAPTGWGMSHAMATRWGFEGIARSLDLGPALGSGGETAAFESALSGSPAGLWAVLAAITAAMVAATVVVVRRR
jgi:ABC-type multidrug transport system ATPase subunit